MSPPPSTQHDSWFALHHAANWAHDLENQFKAKPFVILNPILPACRPRNPQEVTHEFYKALKSSSGSANSFNRMTVPPGPRTQKCLWQQILDQHFIERGSVDKPAYQLNSRRSATSIFDVTSAPGIQEAFHCWNNCVVLGECLV